MAVPANSIALPVSEMLDDARRMLDGHIRMSEIQHVFKNTVPGTQDRLNGLLVLTDCTSGMGVSREMKILLYANGINGEMERLQRTMLGVARTHEIEFCGSVTSMLQRLRRRTADLTVVVLCTSSTVDLAEIVRFRHWFHNIRTILILPDRENQTVSIGLTLRPRFVSFLDSDFSDVSAVLEKMIRVYGNESLGF